MEPGLFMAASSGLARESSVDGYLAETRGWLGEAGCEFERRADYAQGDLAGQYEIWGRCGGEDMALLLLAAVAADDPAAYMVVLTVQMVASRDLACAEHILDTLAVLKPPPG
jgi:hypothetical protein